MTGGTGTVSGMAAARQVIPVERVSGAGPAFHDDHEGNVRFMTARWPLRSYLELGALPTAVPCTRLHARQVLWEWGMKTVAETVELVVSELVTNALRASSDIGRKPTSYDAQGRFKFIRLQLTSDKRQVLVEVWDGNPQPPTPQGLGAGGIPALGEESGRGLFLVEAVSVRWGYHCPAVEPGHELSPGAGKVVWAVLEDKMT